MVVTVKLRLGIPGGLTAAATGLYVLCGGNKGNILCYKIATVDVSAGEKLAAAITLYCPTLELLIPEVTLTRGACAVKPRFTSWLRAVLSFSCCFVPAANSKVTL